MKSAFFRAQKRGMRMYRFMIILPLITIALALTAMILERMYPAGSYRDSLIVNAVFLVCILFFIVFMVRMVRIRGRVYRMNRSKYEALPEDSRREVDADLTARFKHALFGETYFYFISDYFVCFLKYHEIAWVYYRQAAIPLMMFAGNEISTTGTAVQQLSLMVYDDQGERYLIQTGAMTIDVIETLAVRAPNAIYGYSKEREQMAKWDFNDFLKRERAL